MATALPYTPQPGVLFSRVKVISKDLSADEWNHWQNEVMLPDFLYNIEFKSPKGAEGPTLLLRYANADENAPEGWQQMNLIVSPDLKWFDCDRWRHMPCWTVPISPQIGSATDAVLPHMRTYELLDFHDALSPAERGSHMVTIFETPAEGADDDYVNWYTGEHLQDLVEIPGLHWLARYRITAPATPENASIEDEAEIGTYMVIYSFENERYDKAAFQASRNTAAAKQVLGQLRQCYQVDWNMILCGENEEANHKRRLQFRQVLDMPTVMQERTLRLEVSI